MADVIRFRRGTVDEWSAANPTLGPGEPGYETDTGRHKIGTGTKTWGDLPYFFDEIRLNSWASARFASRDAATEDALVVSVKDFGAVGDGQADDTAAIQAAIDGTIAGGVCYFPPGTYLVSAAGTSILTGRSGVMLAGAGALVATIRVASGSAALRVLNLSSRSDTQVKDLGFEANGNAAVRSAVYASSVGGQRNIWVRNCRFADFMPGSATTTYAAIYTWPSDGVHVYDNELTGCGRAITIDQPDGVARVIGNRITSADATKMATGIYIRRSSGVAEGEVVVAENTVRGARLDPAGTGSEGHGIAVFRVMDVQITNNHCEGNARGILVSGLSFGATVQGNTCVGNNDAGIRCEPEIIAKDISVGLDAKRGITVVGNVVRDNLSLGTPGGTNSGLGITMSYAAGSTVSGNIVSGNSGDGIHTDSSRVTIVGNVVYNNWKGYTADPVNGKRGGIRIYAGTGCIVVGNQCFDNQTTKTQMYGLSLSSGGVTHIVHGNQFSGNGTGEVFGADKIVDGFFGVNPVTRRPNPGTATALNAPTVLNNLITSLRELGLIT